MIRDIYKKNKDRNSLNDDWTFINYLDTGIFKGQTHSVHSDTEALDIDIINRKNRIISTAQC